MAHKPGASPKTTGMVGTAESMDPVKNICAIVQERDKRIREADVRINYYKNAIQKALNETGTLEKKKKEIAEEQNFIQEQNKELQNIVMSLESSQAIAMQTLLNFPYFEQLAVKELDAKKKETQQVEEYCRKLYIDDQEKLYENSYYQELEKKEVEFLKLDIQRRDLEIKIRLRKRIEKEKRDIKKQIFYNFFIEMAENYLIEKRMKELEILKVKELEAVRRYSALQEDVKIRQLNTFRNNIDLTNITFGSQDNHLENSHSKVALPQKKQESKLFAEKLDNMFQKDEPMVVVGTPKVKILNQKVIMPAFAAPHFAPTKKRKIETVDMSLKWQKMMKNFSRSSTKNYFSQESEKRLSQSSQQSQADQSGQLTDVTSYYESDKLCKPVTENSCTNKLVMQSQTQDTQRVLSQGSNKDRMVLHQVDENINVRTEPLSTGNHQVTLSTPAHQEYPVSNSEIRRETTSATTDVTYTKSSLSVPKRELIPKTSISEHVKSVRFNLEPTSHPASTKSMLNGQSMFGNIFSPFSSQLQNQNNEVLLQDQVAAGNNSTFSMSIEPAGLEFDSGENESQLKSPEYSYDMERVAQQPFKPPEMPPFGGGFFSFGNNMFNPFNKKN